MLGETDEEPAELKKHLHTPRHAVDSLIQGHEEEGMSLSRMGAQSSVGKRCPACLFGVPGIAQTNNGRHLCPPGKGEAIRESPKHFQMTG